MGRYLPDGRIECIGRRDGQVKVRGDRIELGDRGAAGREWRYSPDFRHKIEVRSTL